MSNRIVSDVYNGVIDDVSKNVKYDFEEMGIEDVVLQELIKVSKQLSYLRKLN